MATTRGASFQKLPPVVGFIDMDCFYVAVERARVVQYPTGERGRPDLPPEADRWRTGGAMGGIIAVSYEARAKGVTRTMSGADARKACPEIILVQVPTAFGKADLRIYKENLKENDDKDVTNQDEMHGEAKATLKGPDPFATAVCCRCYTADGTPCNWEVPEYEAYIRA
ncbi:DNA polymerase eta [Symbiodinium microadriaticum]|uniref:DNA polymerase eta n=1 Tax=Symbiodinium microadriaticum TaxID=2951 RepID=A0A1Q9E025_SYMMI|nr:DNA polymerase eta [Symbiodinium microadriaticum]